MSDNVQVDLGKIADVEYKLNDIISGFNVSQETQELLRKYSKVLDEKIHELSRIILEHEKKINVLEHKLQDR